MAANVAPSGPRFMWTSPHFDSARRVELGAHPATKLGTGLGERGTAECPGGDLCARPQSKLGQDVFEMSAGRTLTDAQARRDVAVAEPLANERDDLALPAGQAGGH